ncbi:hypothetical protein ACM782_14075 [Pseudomonas aeruginosa]
MTKKKPLTPELRAECDAANAIFLAKTNAMGVTKSGLASDIGVSGPAIGYFLDGTNQLNARFASHFSRIMGVPVERFSKRLAEEIKEYRQALLEGDTDGKAERTGIFDAIGSNRSRQAIEKIAAAAASGLLSEDDLQLLSMIAERITSNSNKVAGVNQRIAEKVKDAAKASD